MVVDLSHLDGWQSYSNIVACISTCASRRYHNFDWLFFLQATWRGWHVRKHQKSPDIKKALVNVHAVNSSACESNQLKHCLPHLLEQLLHCKYLSTAAELLNRLGVFCQPFWNMYGVWLIYAHLCIQCLHFFLPQLPWRKYLKSVPKWWFHTTPSLFCWISSPALTEAWHHSMWLKWSWKYCSIFARSVHMYCIMYQVNESWYKSLSLDLILLLYMPFCVLHIHEV